MAKVIGVVINGCCWLQNEQHDRLVQLDREDCYLFADRAGWAMS